MRFQFFKKNRKKDGSSTKRTNDRYTTFANVNHKNQEKKKRYHKKDVDTILGDDDDRYLNELDRDRILKELNEFYNSVQRGIKLTYL